MSIKIATEPDHLQLLAAGFSTTARDFGIEVNPHFPDFLCTIAFTNGVLFHSWHPEEVARLTAIIDSPPVRPGLNLPWAAAQLAQALPKGPADMGALQNVLAPLIYTGVKTPQSDADLPGPLGRAILLGLKLATLQPALVEGIVTWIKGMHHEQAFLMSRLSAWSAYHDLPFAEPIVEFACAFYSDRPRERDLVCGGLFEAWTVARHRPDPWDLSAWVYHAYARGRRLGLSDQKGARAVIEEVPADELNRTLQIYRQTAIGSAGGGEPFDILAATLRYFARPMTGSWPAITTIAFIPGCR